MKEIKYNYRVQPRRGKIYAEVFYIHNNGNKDFEMHLVGKSFKKLFRDACDKDYIDAKKWAVNHIKNINEVNKQ